MSISQSSGSEIALDEAKKLVETFKYKFPEHIKASFVGSESLNLILKQEGCIGVRIYYGYDAVSERLAPVLVGVDEKGEDMSDGIVMDKLKPCPQYCNPTSPFFLEK